MKKRPIFIISGLLILAIVALNMVTTRSNLQNYLAFEKDDVNGVTDILTALQVVHFKDKPGYYGWLGDRYDVKKLINNAEESENNAFDPISRIWINLPDRFAVKQCASDLHDAKLGAIKALRRITLTGTGTEGLIDNAQDKLRVYFDVELRCQFAIRGVETEKATFLPKHDADASSFGPAVSVTPLAADSTPSLEDEYRSLEPNVPAAGDDDATNELIDALSKPKSAADWEFLMKLDKAYSVDCGNAAFCWSRVAIVKQAIANIKSSGLTPPAGIHPDFQIR